MKKPIKLNKKTIKKLKLELKQKNDRKVAPATLEFSSGTDVASNGRCERSNPWYTC
jgi:hypothetical protein